MDHALDLSGTAVTVYGGNDPLDHALGVELGRRGCTTHHVSVVTGWLHSATHAIIRPDTASGVKAMQQLVEREVPPVHLIALRSESTDPAQSARVDDLCRACGSKHHLSVIWHRSLEAAMPTDGRAALPEPVDTTALAAAVADDLVENHTPPHGIRIS